jgi:hypothetical protein
MKYFLIEAPYIALPTLYLFVVTQNRNELLVNIDYLVAIKPIIITLFIALLCTMSYYLGKDLDSRTKGD